MWGLSKDIPERECTKVTHWWNANDWGIIWTDSNISGWSNPYILSVKDYANRYLEAVALKKIETTDVAEAFIEIYSRIGLPPDLGRPDCRKYAGCCQWSTWQQHLITLNATDLWKSLKGL